MISFDCIYVDSTFLSFDYIDFPSQTKSNEQINRIAKSWLLKNSENVVLRPPANYGLEAKLAAENSHKPRCGNGLSLFSRVGFLHFGDQPNQAHSHSRVSSSERTVGFKIVNLSAKAAHGKHLCYSTNRIQMAGLETAR